MRFSLRKIVLTGLLVTLIVILDIAHRIIRKDLQHSDASRLQLRIQRNVSLKEALPKYNVTATDKNNSTNTGQVTEKNATQSKNRVDTKRNSTLDDIFISVKTSNKFHESRVSLQLETWFILAKHQVRESPHLNITYACTFI